MNKSILNSTITAAMAIGLAACSSGSDVAGIGGSGVTPVAVKSSGTITGFGSVYVNGVKYDSSSSTFSIDDNPGIESDLAVGMRVTVNGSVNSDGISGTASSISFNDDLEGPVSNIQPLPYDTTRTLTVLGRQVVIDSTTTSFDVTGVLAGTAFDFDLIANTDHVEISGFLDSNNVMKATRVELKAQPFDINSVVEIKGTIETVNTTLETFTLEGAASTTISYAGATIDNSLPGGVAIGAFVEAKGLCTDASCATVNASKVESGLDDFNDNDKVEVEGIITSLTNQNSFEVNGIPVDASSATRIPASINLAINMEVEVEGTINGSTLIATKVKDESNDLKIEATISSVTPANSSFELEPVSGQTITVMIDKSTEVDDNVGSITNPDDLITSLNSGDFVSVEGYDGGSGMVVASEVERDGPDDIIVQGVITASAGSNISGTVTVLGVTIPYNNNTEFQRADDTPFNNATEFFGAITNGTTLVKVKDKEAGGGGGNTPVGTADEIEIELP
jgi:hypothetical protein